jgi:hypothetical protein
MQKTLIWFLGGITQLKAPLPNSFDYFGRLKAEKE